MSRSALIARLQAVASKSPDYTVGGAEAGIWLADIDGAQHEAVDAFIRDELPVLMKRVARDIAGWSRDDDDVLLTAEGIAAKVADIHADIHRNVDEGAQSGPK